MNRKATSPRQVVSIFDAENIEFLWMFLICSLVQATQMLSQLWSELSGEFSTDSDARVMMTDLNKQLDKLIAK
jgi:hypothetical protein